MNNFDKTVCEVLKIELDNLSDGLSFDNIRGWDSLAQFDLIARLEREFKVSFEIHEILKIVTIGDIKSILNIKLSDK
jgi:acyl carrier protein